MKVRKIICLLLTLTLLFSWNVYGSDETVDDTVEEIQPRYTNINSITSGLSIYTSGVAICTGSYLMINDLKSEIIMTLQRRPKSGNSGKLRTKDKCVTKYNKYHEGSVGSYHRHCLLNNICDEEICEHYGAKA